MYTQHHQHQWHSIWLLKYDMILGPLDIVILACVNVNHGMIIFQNYGFSFWSKQEAKTKQSASQNGLTKKKERHKWKMEKIERILWFFFWSWTFSIFGISLCLPVIGWCNVNNSSFYMKRKTKILLVNEKMCPSNMK